MVPPTIQQQAVKPPPSLTQAPGGPGAPQSQSYSSPYAKDNNKPGEASKGPSQPQPPRPGPPYQTHPPPGSYSGPPGPSGPSPYQSNYRPHPPPPHGLPLTPAPHGQPQQTGPPPPAQKPRYRLPAPDVVDTFKKVFVATYSSKDNFGPAKAEAIVSSAIKRVLEPETMKNVPEEPDEAGVCRAFESILVQSQGPPRQATPSQPAPITQAPSLATSTVANAAVTAATTARAPLVPGANMRPSQTGPNAVYRPPQPHPPPPTNNVQPYNRSHAPVVPPVAKTTPPQSQTQAPRSAEANLMGLLMSAPGKGSPSPVNVTSSAGAQMTITNTAQGNTPHINAPVTASNVSPSNTLQITTPSALSHAGPPINAPKITSPLPSTMSASASKPPMPSTVPVPTANMGQLSQKLNGIAAMRENGTSTPSRPAVEPLTPPPGAAPVLNAPTGLKRGPSPQNEAPGGKKAKVEGGD
jgi:hypothetical protein